MPSREMTAGLEGEWCQRGKRLRHLRSWPSTSPSAPPGGRLPRPRYRHQLDAVTPALSDRVSKPVLKQLDVVHNDDLHRGSVLLAVLPKEPVQARNGRLILVLAPADLTYIAVGWIVRLRGLIQH